MNREQIIQIAREAGFYQDQPMYYDESMLEVFAKLVAEHERNSTWTQAHWTEYERAIVAQEREACAKVCEDLKITGLMLDAYSCNDAKHKCAEAIRARGQA